MIGQLVYDSTKIISDEIISLKNAIKLKVIMNLKKNEKIIQKIVQ